MTYQMTQPQRQLVKEQVTVPTFILQNPQTSVENALEFLKKMTVIAMSEIAYQRQLFDDDAYLLKHVEGNPIKILHGFDDNSRLMIKWMRFAFNLVSDQWLKKIIFVIKDDSKLSKTLETYIFSYDYDEEKICYELLNQESGEIREEVKMPADISNSVQQLLQSIDAITSKLAPINHCGFSVRLELDEGTPDEVLQNSELFTPMEDYDFFFPSEVTKWKLGKIQTKFTTFTVSSKSLLFGVLEDKGSSEEFVEASQPAPEAKQALLDSQSHCWSKTANDVEESTENPFNLSPEDLSLRLSLDVDSQPKMVINCICGCNDDKLNDAIKCVSCLKHQHQSCYNIRKSQDDHICVDCHNSGEGRTCSNADLINNGNLKAEALYRRALMLCLHESQMSSKKLMSLLNVSRYKAQTIFNQLHFDGCFLLKSGRFGKAVDKEHVEKNILKKYFVCPPTTVSNITMETDLDAVPWPKRRHIDEESVGLKSRKKMAKDLRNIIES